jgi:hypothetical protein
MHNLYRYTPEEAESNVGVDQIHVTQELAELLHCISQEFTVGLYKFANPIQLNP